MPPSWRDAFPRGDLPEAWIAPPELRELRELVRYRAKLVALRISAKAQVHAVMAKLGILPTLVDMFGPGGQRYLNEMPFTGAYAIRIASLRDLLEIYRRELAEIEQAVARRLRGHVGYRAVQAINGVGPVMAAIFVAEIGDVSRFHSARHLCSWAGLTPTHRESDIKVTRGHITKMACGRPRLTGGPVSPLEATMTIVGGIDIHRAQLTYDYVDLATGEFHTGRVAPANRDQLRAWLERFHGLKEVAFALEGCTGWRYVVEELTLAGITAHVAEPAETAALRGRKSRAKTDRADALPSSPAPHGRAAAGFLDPASTRARRTSARAALQRPRRRTHRLAATSSRHSWKADFGFAEDFLTRSASSGTALGANQSTAPGRASRLWAQRYSVLSIRVCPWSAQ